MIKRLLFLFLVLGYIIPSFAATSIPDKYSDSVKNNRANRLRISLLTCGTGEEIWESFGHTGIRVIDSMYGVDVVFNYGTFNGFDKDFEINFMQGKLIYFVSIESFPVFMDEYIQLNRKVEEQELIISPEARLKIDSFLKWNSRSENREYKYDFYLDNCATRIRDVFGDLIPGFTYGPALPQNAKLSYRDITDQYLNKRHWERLGIDILLGSKVDKIMTDKEIMFLPDYLRDGLAKAKINGAPATQPIKQILRGTQPTPVPFDQAFALLAILCCITLLGLTIPSLVWLGKIMSFIWLLVSGLLGCLIIVMWFGTNHQACGDNYNVLWALPTNIFLAFMPKKNKRRYALVAILFIGISLLLHLSHVQCLPMFQLSPVLLSLLFVYGNIYRRKALK